MATRDLWLGDIAFITMLGTPTEALGEAVEASGGTVVAGQREPSSFSLEIPVYGGADESNPYTRGTVLRRQVRSLLNNAAARNQGIYLRFLKDSELNAWLMIGKGDLSYGDGGITLADFTLELGECYVLGRRRTHRQARRCEFYDIRTGEIPRDVLGQQFSSSFSAFAALPLAFLPSNISDAWLNESEVVAPGAISGLWASLTSRFGRTTSFPHGSVLVYERDESYEGIGDVRIFDRRTFTAPTKTLAGDKDPEGTYGWERVYGTDAVLTAGDVPVLDNGLCRLSWDATYKTLVMEAAYNSAAYEEIGKFAFQISGGALVAPEAISVHSWTPESATVRFDIRSGTVIRVYVTLARGWRGPKIDCYGYSFGTLTDFKMRWVPYSANAAALIRRADADASDDPGFTWNGTLWWTIGSADEPWMQHHTRSSTWFMGIVPTDIGATVRLIDDNQAYGATRRAVELRLSSSSTSAAYWGAHFPAGVASAAYELEAEAWINSGGTRSLVADANAAPGSGNSAVNDTQTTETAATAIFTNAGALTSLPGGSYQVWARVKNQTGSGTLNVRGYYGASPIAAAVTTTLTGYQWLYLGDISKGSSDLGIWLWGTGGATNVRIDRIAFVYGGAAAPTSTQAMGVRVYAASTMYETRMVPTLVARGAI